MDPNTLKLTAEGFISSGQLPEALEACKKLCEIAPDSAHAWHLRAAVHGMLGQYDAVVPACDRAIAIYSTNASIHFNRANALFELRRFADAEAAFDDVLRLEPENVNALSRLGELHGLAGNYVDSADCFRRALEIDSSRVQVAVNLAYALLAAGEPDRAACVCRDALEHAPENRTLLLACIECSFHTDDAEQARERIRVATPFVRNIYNQLYRICRKLFQEGKYREAVFATGIALELYPDDAYFGLLQAESQVKLGNNADASALLDGLPAHDITLEASVQLSDAYSDTGDSDRALEQLRETVKRFPDEQIPVARLARHLCREAKNTQAIALLEGFLASHPDSPRVLVELGTLMEYEDRYVEAEELYKRAIACDPEYAIAYSRLGILNQHSQRYTEARECLEQALERDPGLTLVRCGLAYLYSAWGDYEASLAQYDQLLASDPNLEEAIAGKAGVLERTGNSQAAYDLLEPLIKAGTESIHTRLAFAHACHVAGRQEDATALLEASLLRQDLLPGDRMHACFVLGKLYDRMGRYDDSFRSYRNGNDMNRSPFDADAHLRFIESTLSVFSEENLATFPRSSISTRKPVFVVGMPRSGTTLTEQILASHPDVYGAGELAHIRGLAARLQESTGSKHQFPLCVHDVSQDVIDSFSAEHLATLESLAAGESRVVDKMPSNFMFLGLISMLYPGARILHCVRDPMDTGLSCYFQNFSSGQFFSYRLEDIAFYYNQYRRVMAHWKSMPGIRIMDVNYEQLVGDPECVSRDMLEFIGIEWHPACMEFHKSSRTIRTASYDQVRRPMYQSSVNRWKNYEHYLSGLKKGLEE